ncbi:hypothetical protein B0H16DRAFT_1465756 [Mycena metata]|uniref:F-box domain-containing protein n=1 Tax=Mycena metata TaxID=1033252 RepID=A0AAD7I9X3_9AGAR|nr:hypothetical protein B0H16DRAFT_1465756 [Mycena metata]
MSLTEFPQDLLLEVANQLDIGDLVNFLSLCRVIRELQLHRILWLNALARIKTVELQPLPVSNLQELSLAQLQRTARQTARLLTNFKSESPRPTHIRSFSIEPDQEMMCIPGTSLLVTSNIGIVSCWDITTAQRVAHLELADLRLQIKASCVEPEGKVLIPGRIGRSFLSMRNLTVVCVDFRDRASITISHTISRATTKELDYFPHSHFFLDSRVLGFCTKTSIISWGLDSDGEINVKAQENCCPPSTPTPRCLLFGKRLYMLHKGASLERVAIYSVPFWPAIDRQTNAIDDALEPPISTVLPLPYPPFPDLEQLLIAQGFSSRSYHSDHVSVPEFGIFAVTCTDLARTKAVIHFWPGSIDTALGMLSFEPSCVYGHPDMIDIIAVGSWGTYVAFIAHEVPTDESMPGADAPYLGLLHFSPTPSPHTTFRKLDVGDASLSNFYDLDFDESLGLVVVADNLGNLTAISYV